MALLELKNIGYFDKVNQIVSGGKEATVLNAKAENPTMNSINLSWDVEAGQTPTGFTIEMSTDGTNFSPLADLASNQTTYTASGLTQGTRYYFNIIAKGTINSDSRTVWNTTSGSLSVDDLNAANAFKIYPNPSRGNLYVKTKKDINQLSLYSLDGRLIKTINKPNRVNDLAYGIDHIPKGTFVLVLRTLETQLTKLIIVQ